LIGAQGSLQESLRQCKAAISYPGAGLPLLLRGPTGTGKSFLAHLMLWGRLRRNVERAIIIPGSRVIHAGENKLKSYNSATILQV
ncbi:sigma 54-interacting transcriptional regulator, partial [Salmonella enterica subsp. enterica serovar Kentucky]|nr:sigma 54-interacting transcriptional regulator [Salmonella enterica subsp. enterica serovar Kentucky]